MSSASLPSLSTHTVLPQIILGEIRQLSQSHVVHPGLTLFANLAPGTSLDPSQVPGLTQSGWTPEMDELCVLLSIVARIATDEPAGLADPNAGRNSP